MNVMKRRISIVVSSLALSAALGAAAPCPAHAEGPAPASTASAAELYRQATRLYAAQKLTEAEPLYQAAWDLQHSYDIASNLGALKLELGKPRQAAELLTHALQQFPVRGRSEERAALEARLSAARKLVGTLRVKVDVPGADIRLDGLRLGRAPLPAEVFVDPGAHVIEASFPGYADTRLRFQAPRGVTLDVRLPMAPPATPRRSLAPVIVGASLGAVAAGLGAALLVLGHGQETEAKSLHDTLAAKGQFCGAPTSTCDALRAATARSDRFGNAGIAMFGVAGAAAVGTVTYLLWPRSQGARTPDVRASLGFTPSGAGALVTGSF